MWNNQFLDIFKSFDRRFLWWCRTEQYHITLNSFCSLCPIPNENLNRFKFQLEIWKIGEAKG